MTIHNSMALRRVSAYLRARMALQTGGQRLSSFMLTFDIHSDEPSRNYAVPDDELVADAWTLSALSQWFAQRRRRPRLEYIDELAPSLLPALMELGFALEAPLSLMTCDRGDLSADSDLTDVAWTLAESESELHAAAQVQNHAYGVARTTDADVERLYRVVDHGGAVALALCQQGLPLGAGLYTPPIDGVTEIAAIGVHVDARRRGIGRAVSALLAEHAFVQGVEFPFLMTEAVHEDRIYAQAGFHRFGRLLAVSKAG
jgi:ribosomal protein S18 acetylase RimI-like enzyme